MSIIIQNPFRTLGVYSNASAREIAANKSKMSAYLRVGQGVALPTDNLLSESMHRTTESVDEAVSSINLPNDKLKYAMFWFIKATSIDENALNHLAAGDKEKASELFGKRETFSALQNTSTLALYNEDYDTAIATATKLIHEDEFRTAFVQAVCGETFLIKEDEMAHLFIDTLCEEFPNEDWRQIFNNSGESSDDDEYLNAKAVGKPLKQIESAIAKAKSVDRNDAEANYNAGTTLMNSTKKPLAELKEILGTEDMQYQMIADKLANQILQCGINYFNETDDDDDVDKALIIQEYASIIAVGQMAKDRCKQNMDILKRRKEESGIRSDLEAIADALKSFQSKTNTIQNAKNLIEICRPHLAVLKNKFGSDNDLYLKISSAVANNALSMLISVCNKNSDSKTTARSALDVMDLILQLDMDNSTRLRFSKNKSVLESNILHSLSTGLKVDYANNDTLPNGCLPHGCLPDKSDVIEKLLIPLAAVIGLGFVITFPIIGISIIVIGIIGYIVFKKIKR